MKGSSQGATISVLDTEALSIVKLSRSASQNSLIYCFNGASAVLQPESSSKDMRGAFSSWSRRCTMLGVLGF